MIYINRNNKLNESISWMNLRQRMCVRGLGRGLYPQFPINRGKEIWGSWVLVSGCRSFLTLKNSGRKGGGRSGHRPSAFPGGD